MEELYPWERRWVDISTKEAADSPRYPIETTGYVAATEWQGEGSVLIGSTLDEIREQPPCVILLGEPGIGKTSEWEKLRVAHEDSEQHLFLNLGAFGSEELLKDELKDDPKIVQWQQAEYPLTLWLDSLDEGLLHVTKLQEGLLRILRKMPVARLRLRITCRNAVWPLSFTTSLGSLWGFGQQPEKHQLRILLLRPLTQQQVAEAAQVEGLPEAEFLEAVEAADAQPLAGIPVTLRLLLRLYKRHQPGFGVAEKSTRAGLYEQGCLELCDAPDEKRDENFRVDGRQRLVLAGYLAYLAVLSNRRQIYLEPARGVLDDNSLDPYAAGSGQTAAWHGLRAEVTPAAIRDLLKNTSLFTDLGNGRMVWIHQAFAEFLAAWYLHLTGMTLPNLRALFRSVADPAGGVVPALRETAAWLAELQPAFWQELLALDVLALVRGELRTLNSAQREAVVAELLNKMATLAYPPYLDSRDQSFMLHLQHPRLAGQLEAILTADEAPGAAAHLAADIAKTCQVQALSPILVALTLDETRLFSQRARALDILREIAIDTEREALRALIHRMPAEDERDEFRGDLLRTLWPTHLAADELLPLLTLERDDHYHGTYHYFLYELERADLHFSSEIILRTLRWLTVHVPTLDDSYERSPTQESFWKRTCHLVWQQAWQSVDIPGVLEAMTDLYIVTAKHYQPYSIQGASDAARIQVFRSLLKQHRRLDWVCATYDSEGHEALISEQDWPALFSLLSERLSFSRRHWLARILMSLLRDAVNHVPAALYCQRLAEFHAAMNAYRSVRKAWDEWWKPTDLEAEETQKRRRNFYKTRKYQRKQTWEKRNHRRVKLRKATGRAKIIWGMLRQQVSRRVRQWHWLLSSFHYDKAKNVYTHHSDPTQSKRWKRLPQNWQETIGAKLWEYIAEHPVPPVDWYGPHRRTTYGAEILRDGLELLIHWRPEQVKTLPAEFWRGWARFLVWFDDNSDKGGRYELLKLAAQHAPTEVQSAILERLDQRDEEENTLFYRFKEWYGLLPGGRFTALLLQGIEHGVWQEALSGQLLVDMLAVGFAPAWEYVRELLDVPPGTGVARPRLAVAVYGALLFRKENYLPDAWQYWEWLSNDLENAQAVIAAHVSHPFPSEFGYLAVLAEEELETLVLWLTWACALEPGDVDDWKDTTGRGPFASLRTAAAAELASRGTMGAWHTLRQLAESLGEPFWLRFRLDQVRENLRRNAWAAASPPALIELSQQASRRWVQSATDLQELVLDSLARYQAALHNELQAALALWIPEKSGNRITGHHVRDENFLSAELRRHLTLDLRRPEILVQREVEIRSSTGEGTGQRTDLYITAFTPGPEGRQLDLVTVVVEVKLAKNREVDDALPRQLVPYLADQPYKHGIYLIGWHYGEFDPLPASKKNLLTQHAHLANQTQAVPAEYQIRTLLLDMRLPADRSRSADNPALFQPI